MRAPGALGCAGGRYPLAQFQHRRAHRVGELAIGASALGIVGERAQLGVGNDATDSDLDRAAMGDDAAFAENLVSSADADREHVASAAQRQVAGAAFEFVDCAVG